MVPTAEPRKGLPGTPGTLEPRAASSELEEHASSLPDLSLLSWGGGQSSSGFLSYTVSTWKTGY